MFGCLGVCLRGLYSKYFLLINAMIHSCPACAFKGKKVQLEIVAQPKAFRSPGDPHYAKIFS